MTRAIAAIAVSLAVGCSSNTVPSNQGDLSAMSGDDLSHGSAGDGGGSTSGDAQACAGTPLPMWNGAPDLSATSTDPRAIATAHCSDGSVTVDIAQVSVQAGLFSAVVKRAQPAFDGAYCVNMLFSGDWGWQVSDVGGGNHVAMLIDLGGNMPGNLTVHGASGATQVQSVDLQCTSTRNH